MTHEAGLLKAFSIAASAVFEHAHLHHQPLQLAILRQQADAAAMAAAGERGWIVTPRSRTSPVMPLSSPKSAAPSSLRPGADQPGDAEHFALFNSNETSWSFAVVRFETESSTSLAAGRAVRVHCSRSRPTIMRMSASRVVLPISSGADGLTVSQHRDAVADPKNLIHLMRHVNDGDTALLQVGDQSK